MASNSESRFSSEDSDVIKVDRFLDYINQILMEEGIEDVTCMQPDADVLYKAIMNSFYEDLPPDSSAYPNGYEDISDLHATHRISAYHEDGLNEKPVTASECNDGIMGMTNEVQKLGAPRVSLPAPEGLMFQRSYSSKEQGDGHVKSPLTDEELALRDIDVSLEDLKLVADYSALYVGEPSLSGTSTRVARGSRQNGDKKQVLAVADKGRRTSGDKVTAAVQGFVDLTEVLVSCAQAVAVGDTRRANEILQELRLVHGASPNGSTLQRIAHYFGEALLVRMRGLGGQQYRALCNNTTILLLSKLGFQVGPYMKILFYFANQTILKAAEGASRLHIVDYGFLYGMQWPCLINALADRIGGPPLLVITGIDFPQSGHYPAKQLEESGRRLAAYARTYSVPFEYHTIATSKWEGLTKASLHLHEDEVLVINCMMRLCHLADESVDVASATSPRQELLTHMHSLNPHLLLFADLSTAYNSPYFVSRFREALYAYSSVFDLLETLCGDSPNRRLILERNCCYHDILNIVACEGAERVERPETYRQWQLRIKRAGFEQLPISPTFLSRSKSHVKQHYWKDFFVDEDANQWMLLGWKGRTLIAASAWKPSPV